MLCKRFAIYDLAGSCWLASLKIRATYNSVVSIFFPFLTNVCLLKKRLKLFFYELWVTELRLQSSSSWEQQLNFGELSLEREAPYSTLHPCPKTCWIQVLESRDFRLNLFVLWNTFHMATAEWVAAHPSVSHGHCILCSFLPGLHPSPQLLSSPKPVSPSPLCTFIPVRSLAWKWLLLRAKPSYSTL